MPSDPRPRVTLVMNGRIMDAECTHCHGPVGSWSESDPIEGQYAKLNEEFVNHVKRWHPDLYPGLTERKS